MSSNIKKQLEEVKQNIIHGNYQDGIKLLDKLSKIKYITLRDQLQSKVFRSKIMLDLGKTKEVITLADEVLKESKEKDSILLQLDALIQKAFAQFFSYKGQEPSIKTLDKSFELLETIPSDVHQKELTERKAWMILLRNQINLTFLGDNSRQDELYQEGLTSAKESQNKQIITRFLIHFNRGREISKIEKWRLEAEQAVEALGNKLELSLYYANYADYLGYKKRDYEQAIKAYEKALALRKEISSTYFIDHPLINMGNVYRAKFQLDKAMECFQEGLKEKSIGYFLYHGNIGWIYYQKYDLVKAQEYMSKYLTLCEELGNISYLPAALYNNIHISIELRNLSQAKNHLKRLKQLSDETGLEWINNRYQSSKMLILKASNNLSDLEKAVKLATMLLEQDDLDPSSKLDLLYSLLEIRLKVLQIKSNDSALEEVKKRLIHLEVEAEEQNHQWLLGNVYRLHSQLALINLDIETALEFLQKARSIADMIDVELLKKNIEEDQEKINQHLSLIQRLQEKKAPISETLNLVSLEKSVQNIKQETILEERDEETGKIIEYRKLFALRI